MCSWLRTGLRIGIAIISHDTKNIYEPGRQAYSDASCLSFYHVAQRRWRRADCNCTDALYMVGLRVRWLVARLRQASPVNMPYSLAGLSESNKHTAQDQQTCCCEKGVYNICNEGMPHQISKSLSRDSIFIKAYDQSLNLASISFPSVVCGATWFSFQIFGNFYGKVFWAVVTLGTFRIMSLPSPWLWVGDVVDQVTAGIQDSSSSPRMLSPQ